MQEWRGNAKERKRKRNGKIKTEMKRVRYEECLK